MVKRFLIEKPALVEHLKTLKQSHFDAMEIAAELRANGKETEYSPRDYEMQAYAINSALEVVANTPAYNLEVVE